MKVKYKEIVKANEPLMTLAKEKVTVKEAVSIARVVKALRDEVAIYQEKEKEIIEKYGEVEDSGRFFIKNDVMSDFDKEFGELLDFEVELNIEPVKLTSDIHIDADTVIAVEKFIDFE